MENSRHYNSYKDTPEYQAYRQKQRKKTIKILSIVVPVAIIGIAGFIFLIMGIIKNSDAYNVAIKEIKVNREVLKTTGGIVDFGTFPSGSIQTTNDSGYAQLTITVKGKVHDAKVNVELSKDPGSEWHVLSMQTTQE